MEISLELNQDEIFDRFEDEIFEEHTFAAYGFDVNKISGDSFDDKLHNLLLEVVTLLKGIQCKKHTSLSIYLEPTTLGWSGSSGPAICLYVGSSDDEFSGSIVDKLNNLMMKMKSYVSAESAPPDEDAPFIGYYAPKGKVLYLSNSLQLSCDIANSLSPIAPSSKTQGHIIASKKNISHKAENTNNPELCLNLWYYLDAEAGYVYALSGRAYWLSGSDEEKLHTLKKLSATDYKMARRFRLPDRFKLHFGDVVKNGYATPDMIRAQGINAFEEILQELEEEFPPIPKTINGEIVMQEMKIPDNALCLYTALKEVVVGEITPVVA